MCTYADKDEAKGLGARWDNDAQSWYVPAGVQLDQFRKWLPEGQHYLHVPFAEKDDAKALGARWDKKRGSWYVPAGQDVAPFAKWDPPARAPATPTRNAHTSTTSTPATAKRGRDEMSCPVHKVPLVGPRTVRNGMPHNIGRQFFVCPCKTKEDDCGLRGGWKWADGTDPFSEASCRRVEQHHGLDHDAVGVGASLPGGLFDLVGDELRDGHLVNGRVQRRRA